MNKYLREGKLEMILSGYETKFENNERITSKKVEKVS